MEQNMADYEEYFDGPDLSESTLLADLRPPTPPPGVPTRRWRRNQSETGDALSLHRGKHAGHYEAYLAIKDEHPRVARKILKAFGMNERGEVDL